LEEKGEEEIGEGDEGEEVRLTVAGEE